MTPDDVPAPTRRASRVVLLDADRRVLLFSCADPARPELGQWWFTPGGGLEDGESLEDAARRETLEETGITLDELPAPFHHQRSSFDFEGVHYEQDEAFFLVDVGDVVLDTGSWTADERRTLTGHRWWSESALAATADVVYPLGLLGLLRAAGAFCRG